MGFNAEYSGSCLYRIESVAFGVCVCDSSQWVLGKLKKKKRILEKLEVRRNKIGEKDTDGTDREVW